MILDLEEEPLGRARVGFGDDPDAWLTEYTGAEVSTLTGRYHINLRGLSS